MIKKFLSLSILLFSSLPVSAKMNKYFSNNIELLNSDISNSRNFLDKNLIECSKACFTDKKNIEDILGNQNYDEIYENEMIFKELF
ncbi:hypothetical protein [Silvanigrella sp.]|jgi:hypothetical protein|uniref:hypothetical protein n=1 Tax=Silvanigrella sp. TaxID=2024976 RepID=UPI0037C9DAF6